MESEGKERWLRLGEAARVLQVSPSTVRLWADQGYLRAHRTPGKQRRFLLSDLERLQDMEAATFLVSAPTAESEPLPPFSVTLAPADSMIAWARHALTTPDAQTMRWNALYPEAGRERAQIMGRRLMALAIQYLAKRYNHNPVLDEARLIARAYGHESAVYGLRTVDLVGAVHFFRRFFAEALHGEAHTPGDDVEGWRLMERLNEFMEIVLIAALEGFEESRPAR